MVRLLVNFALSMGLFACSANDAAEPAARRYADWRGWRTESITCWWVDMEAGRASCSMAVAGRNAIVDCIRDDTVLALSCVERAR